MVPPPAPKKETGATNNASSNAPAASNATNAAANSNAANNNANNNAGNNAGGGGNNGAGVPNAAGQVSLWNSTSNLDDENWKTFIFMLAPDLIINNNNAGAAVGNPSAAPIGKGPASSSTAANASSANNSNNFLLNDVINSFFESVSLGLRQKFRVLGKLEIIGWALENKSYDTSTLVKNALESVNNNLSEVPMLIVAKALKTMLMAMKKEALDKRNNVNNALGANEGSMDNLNANTAAAGVKGGPAAGGKTAGARPPSAAATPDDKKGGAKKNNNAAAATPATPTAAASTASTGKGGRGALGPGAGASRLAGNLNLSGAGGVANVVISDEPEGGPDVYIVLRDLIGPAFINAALEIKLFPSSIIRLTSLSNLTNSLQSISSNSNNALSPNAPGAVPPTTTLDSNYQVLNNLIRINPAFANLKIQAFSNKTLSAWKAISFTEIQVDPPSPSASGNANSASITTTNPSNATYAATNNATSSLTATTSNNTVILDGKGLFDLVAKHIYELIDRKKTYDQIFHKNNINNNTIIEINESNSINQIFSYNSKKISNAINNNSTFNNNNSILGIANILNIVEPNSNAASNPSNAVNNANTGLTVQGVDENNPVQANSNNATGNLKRAGTKVPPPATTNSNPSNNNASSNNQAPSSNQGQSTNQSQLSQQQQQQQSTTNSNTDLRHYNSILDSLPSVTCVSVELIVAAIVEQVGKSLSSSNNGTNTIKQNRVSSNSNLNENNLTTGTTATASPTRPASASAGNNLSNNNNPSNNTASSTNSNATKDNSNNIANNSNNNNTNNNNEDWSLVATYFDRIMGKYLVVDSNTNASGTTNNEIEEESSGVIRVTTNQDDESSNSSHNKAFNNNSNNLAPTDVMQVIHYGDSLGEQSVPLLSLSSTALKPGKKNFSSSSSSGLSDQLRRLQALYTTNCLAPNFTFNVLSQNSSNNGGFKSALSPTSLDNSFTNLTSATGSLMNGATFPSTLLLLAASNVASAAPSRKQSVFNGAVNNNNNFNAAFNNINFSNYSLTASPGLRLIESKGKDPFASSLLLANDRSKVLKLNHLYGQSPLPQPVIDKSLLLYVFEDMLNSKFPLSSSSTGESGWNLSAWSFEEHLDPVTVSQRIQNLVTAGGRSLILHETFEEEGLRLVALLPPLPFNVDEDEKNSLIDSPIHRESEEFVIKSWLGFGFYLELQERLAKLTSEVTSNPSNQQAKVLIEIIKKLLNVRSKNSSGHSTSNYFYDTCDQIIASRQKYQYAYPIDGSILKVTQQQVITTNDVLLSAPSNPLANCLSFPIQMSVTGSRDERTSFNWSYQHPNFNSSSATGMAAPFFSATLGGASGNGGSSSSGAAPASYPSNAFNNSSSFGNTSAAASSGTSNPSSSFSDGCIFSLNYYYNNASNNGGWGFDASASTRDGICTRFLSSGSISQSYPSAFVVKVKNEIPNTNGTTSNTVKMAPGTKDSTSATANSASANSPFNPLLSTWFNSNSHFDTPLHRVIQPDGTILLYYRDEAKVKILYANGTSILYHHQNQAPSTATSNGKTNVPAVPSSSTTMLVTNTDGSRYLMNNAVNNASNNAVLNLPALQQVSQYFAESHQTMITRSDLTVVSFIEDILLVNGNRPGSSGSSSTSYYSSSEDSNSSTIGIGPVAMITEHNDGTRIICRFNPLLVHRLMNNLKSENSLLNLANSGKLSLKRIAAKVNNNGTVSSATGQGGNNSTASIRFLNRVSLIDVIKLAPHFTQDLIATCLLQVNVEGLPNFNMVFSHNNNIGVNASTSWNYQALEMTSYGSVSATVANNNLSTSSASPPTRTILGGVLIPGGGLRNTSNNSQTQLFISELSIVKKRLSTFISPTTSPSSSPSTSKADISFELRHADGTLVKVSRASQGEISFKLPNFNYNQSYSTNNSSVSSSKGNLIGNGAEVGEPVVNFANVGNNNVLEIEENDGRPLYRVNLLARGANLFSLTESNGISFSLDEKGILSNHNNLKYPINLTSNATNKTAISSNSNSISRMLVNYFNSDGVSGSNNPGAIYWAGGPKLFLLRLEDGSATEFLNPADLVPFVREALRKDLTANSHLVEQDIPDSGDSEAVSLTFIRKKKVPLLPLSSSFSNGASSAAANASFLINQSNPTIGNGAGGANAEGGDIMSWWSNTNNNNTATNNANTNGNNNNFFNGGSIYYYAAINPFTGISSTNNSSSSLPPEEEYLLYRQVIYRPSLSKSPSAYALFREQIRSTEEWFQKIEQSSNSLLINDSTDTFNAPPVLFGGAGQMRGGSLITSTNNANINNTTNLTVLNQQQRNGNGLQNSNTNNAASSVSIAREILRKYHQVELAKKAQAEFHLKMKRKIIREMRSNKNSSNSGRGENVGNSTTRKQSTTSMALSEHRKALSNPNSTRASPDPQQRGGNQSPTRMIMVPPKINKAWQHYYLQKKACESGAILNYFESEAGQAFLREQEELAAATNTGNNRSTNNLKRDEELHGKKSRGPPAKLNLNTKKTTKPETSHHTHHPHHFPPKDQQIQPAISPKNSHIIVMKTSVLEQCKQSTLSPSVLDHFFKDKKKRLLEGFPQSKEKEHSSSNTNSGGKGNNHINNRISVLVEGGESNFDDDKFNSSNITANNNNNASVVNNTFGPSAFQIQQNQLHQTIQQQQQQQANLQFQPNQNYQLFEEQRFNNTSSMQPPPLNSNARKVSISQNMMVQSSTLNMNINNMSNISNVNLIPTSFDTINSGTQLDQASSSSNGASTRKNRTDSNCPNPQATHIPAYLKAGSPQRVENIRYLAVEEPVRRRLQTSSVATLPTSQRTRGLLIHPTSLDWGTLCQGFRYQTKVILSNVGWDSERFKVTLRSKTNPSSLRVQTGGRGTSASSNNNLKKKIPPLLNHQNSVNLQNNNTVNTSTLNNSTNPATTTNANANNNNNANSTTSSSAYAGISLMQLKYRTGLLAAGMDLAILVDIQANLPNPQMISFTYTDIIDVHSERSSFSVPVRAHMLRYSAYDERKKKEKRVLHAPNVYLVSRDGQKEEIPIDELY